MTSHAKTRRYHEIGMILRQARIDAGLKQHEIAELMWPGVYLQTARNRVSDVECGKSRMPQDELNRYADIFGMPHEHVALEGKLVAMPLPAPENPAKKTRTITISITVPADADVSVTTTEAAS